jgi:anti-anti-sigma factor
METKSDKDAVCVALDPHDPDATLRRVRELLAQPGLRELKIGLSGVDYLDPSALRALANAADAAEEAKREILLTGAAPPLYKALQIAGLADRFRRSD